MGVTVRAKSKGEWWVFICHKGKRRSKKVGDKIAATRVAREAEALLAKGDLGMVKDRVPTLATYAEKHIDSPIHEWTEGTRESYRRNLTSNIMPFPIARMPLDEIRLRHVKDWIGELKTKGLAKGTIQLVLVVLHGVFEAARVDEYVTANPCQRAGRFIGNGTVTGIVPFTAEEAQGIIDRAGQVYGDRERALFTLLLRAGTRIGEALALEWSDLDLDARIATVSKNWDHKRGKMGRPKTKRSREVDLTPATVAALQALRDIHGKDYHGPLFIDGSGARLPYPIAVRRFKKIRPRDLSIHACRHTYATIRLSRGHNLVDVSAQLGHRDAAFTLKRYVHWIPRAHRGQVDELDTLHLSAPQAHPCPETRAGTVH